MTRLRERLRDDSGAVAVLTAMCMLFVISATALSVDVGRVVSSERSLEKTVDLAALDTVRALEDAQNSPTGIPGGADPETAFTAVAEQSAARNNFDAGDTDQGNSLWIELGLSDPATKVFTPVPFAAWTTANAVKVHATHREDYAFVPGSTGLNEAGVARTNVRTTSVSCPLPCVTPPPPPPPPPPPTPCAPGDPACPVVTDADPWAQISVGSTLGSFDSRESFMDPVLSEMLGTSVDIDAAGYAALVGANVTLGALWSRLGIDAGSTDEVLGTQVRVADLLAVTADLLNDKGDPSSVTAASAIAGFAGSVDPSLTASFGDIFDLAMGNPGAAASSSVNVMDMITVAAEVANGDNLIVFDLPVTIPGVARTRVTLALVERPQIAAGPPGVDANGNYITVARTAQARMFLELDLTSTVTVGTTQVPLRMPLYVDAGQARSALHGVECDPAKANTKTGVISQTDALTVRFGDVAAASLFDETVTVQAGSIGSVTGVGSITGAGSMTIAGATKDSTFTGPHQDADGSFLRVDHLGSSAVQLDALRTDTAITVSLTGLGLPGTVQSQVAAILSPVYDLVEQHVLGPISQTPPGVTLAGADVVNMDTECTFTTVMGS